MSAPIEPITKSLAYDQLTKEEFVSQHIREAIVAGRLRPGDRLRQVQLAQELGTSPTPVREALHSLVKEGWLVHIPHIGVSVAEINNEGVEEAYRLRAMVESDLAAEAARKITPEELEQIRATNEELDKALREGDHTAGRFANFRFHEQVWAAARSPIALGFLNSLWARIPWSTLNDLPGRHDRSVEEHAAVVEALAARDPDRAREAFAAHIRSGRADHHRSQARQAGA